MHWPLHHFPVSSLGLAFAAAVLMQPASHLVGQADAPYLIVLGIAQDGGVPQAGATPSSERESDEFRRLVVSLAVVDPKTGERWMVEATPDFPAQLRALDRIAPARAGPSLQGIFLTHAHMGHYTGLMHLGHEAMGARGIPVYVMPRMAEFLRTNGPWSQLVRLENITLRLLEDGVPVRLNERLSVTPLVVPHRQEYSEVVGYHIQGPERSVLFIPDIDRWDAWDRAGHRIEDMLARVDVAYLDGTFFADREVGGRDMSAFPHPFITTTMERLGTLPEDQRAKVRFIHLNHTNPALHASSPARAAITRAGFNVAEELERVPLGESGAPRRIR
jgi:pyrroloquinoline quinone biosynthesis protein B